MNWKKCNCILNLAVSSIFLPLSISYPNFALAQTNSDNISSNNASNTECFSTNSQNISVTNLKSFETAEIKPKSNLELNSQLDLLQNGNFDSTINLIAKSKKAANSRSKGLKYYCPCFYGASFCCWR